MGETAAMLKMCMRRKGDATERYASWRALSLDVFAELNCAEHFRAARQRAVLYGVAKIRQELEGEGFVDPATEQLTIGIQPFNFFARIASRQVVQNNMIEAQE